MAEIKLSDLPLISEADFTANDRFVMVNDGDGAAMSKTVFDSWIANNVQGEQGEQGVAGRDGANGINGRDGVDGADGLSAYQVAVNSGYAGTQEQWLLSLKGATGAAGSNGSDGWSPMLRIVPRGSDNILQLYDWTSGTGSKPTTLGYIGSTGIVTNPANAVNIRGLKGDTGEQGIQGEQGETGIDGVDGRTVESIVFNPDLSVTVTYTDNTTATSDAPPKQYGWGVYRDGQYRQTSPLTIPANTQVIIPNNAATIIENLPTAVNSFYNPTNQKYLLQDTLGWYTIRVKFKVAASNQPSYINLSMNDGTTELAYTEDRSLRGDNQIHYVDLVSEQYGNAALTSNGLSISIKAYERAISIYDVEVSIAKTI